MEGGVQGTRAVPIELATRPAALGLLLARNVGDVITTHWVLALGGRETNPVAAQLLTHSLATLLAAKLAVIAVIVLAAVLGPARHAVRSARMIWLAVLVYGLVVTWNAVQVLSARLA